MHYYKRNIGDYHKKAGRLSMLEHGAYTLLIDSCYDRERFPTLEDAIEWTWARSEEEIAAVKFVLGKFFNLEDGIYIQDRIKEELGNYHSNSEINRRIALEREEARRKKKARTVHEPCTNEHEPPPNQEPRTKNQEPNKTTIPKNQIIELYNSVLSELPNIQKWTKTRNSLLETRWNEDSARQNLEWWSKFFTYISRSDFLMGRANSFQANIDWILNASNFVKILEGNYENRKSSNN